MFDDIGITPALRHSLLRAEGAAPKDDGTFRGSLHQLHGDVRAKLGGGDYGYVSQLEASEDH